MRDTWADNPDGANLYNNEGLLASPFKTDEYGNHWIFFHNPDNSVL